jgi:hypothetical protein
MEKSYTIKRILGHAAITDQPDKFDYYVQFAIPDSTPVWISAEMFDSTIPIEQYWKGAKQTLKTNSINCSTHDENLNVDNETHNGDINAENALMEGVGLTSVSETLCQPSTDLTQQTDRPAVIPLDAQLQTEPLRAAVPLDVPLQTDPLLAVVPPDVPLQTDPLLAVVPLDVPLQTDPLLAVKPTKRKPSWAYEDINVPAPRDITPSAQTNAPVRTPSTS